MIAKQLYPFLSTAILFAFSFSFANNANGQIITTIVGNGTPGFSGDGGPATTAQLSRPCQLSIDRNGNLYIADFLNNRIRKVSVAGIISTVAGNNTSGFVADGIAATAAALNEPTGVDVDTNGNVYIADQSNQRIRKVSMTGIITTVAGTGNVGFSGDGGPATAAELHHPTAVLVTHAGNLIITENGDSRIREVNAAGVIKTIAGNGTQGYSGDGGAATAAQLNRPISVTTDTSGNLFIADYYNNCVRKVDLSGTITTIAGNGSATFSGDGGPASLAALSGPHSLAMDKFGNLYVSDLDNRRVRKISPTGIISTIAGDGTLGYSGDGGPATAAQIGFPNGVRVDGSGCIYIANNSNYCVRKVYPANARVSDLTVFDKSLFRISPNPSSGIFTINFFVSPVEPTPVVITNISGQIVRQMTVANRDTEVNLNVPSGVYFITAEIDGRKETKQIIVN